MPNWLVQFLIGELTKYLTPDVIARVEGMAKQFACCELQRLAKQTSTPIDDSIVLLVANALGADLSKCPA